MLLANISHKHFCLKQLPSAEMLRAPSKIKPAVLFISVLDFFLLWIKFYSYFILNIYLQIDGRTWSLITQIFMKVVIFRDFKASVMQFVVLGFFPQRFRCFITNSTLLKFQPHLCMLLRLPISCFSKQGRKGTSLRSSQSFFSQKKVSVFRQKL